MIWPGPVRGLVRIAQEYPFGAVGACTLVLIGLAAVCAPLLAPTSPEAQLIRIALEPPSAAHPLGTDDLGRDILSRLLYGARVSLGVGVAAPLVAAVIGVAAGLVSGYVGGWVESVIMRAIDVLLAFPTLVLAIAIVGVMGPSLLNATLAIAIAALPHFARIIRAETVRLKGAEFVEAATSIGVRDRDIMIRHILPNTAGLIVIQFALAVAFAILNEASLSFLGLGVQPPTPSWGSMLRAGYPFVAQAPWISVPSGLAISITVLSATLLGDAIRDRLDPRLRR